MRYQTKSCPHCHFKYEILQRRRVWLYGSPIRTCRQCGRQFVDKDYEELALRGEEGIVKKHVAPGKVFSILLFGSVFGVLLIDGTGTFTHFPGEEDFLLIGFCALLFCGFLYSAFSEYREYNKRIKEQVKELRASEKRLSNRQYALQLKDLGYKVPEKYLAPTSCNDIQPKS